MSAKMYFSTYEERLAQTPAEDSGRWDGERGESLCLPNSKESKAVLDSKGLTGIQYKNGEPDFSPVSESTVKIGYMNEERYNRNVYDGRDSKKTVYGSIDESGKLVEPHNKASHNSMADIQMKYSNPGNFDQADILTAENWSQQKKDGRVWTAEQVADYRKENGLTWHECNDGETMMLVPEAINNDFGHLGGVGGVKRRNEIIDQVNDEYDAQFEDDAEVNHELLAAREEVGYENMDAEEQAEFDEIFYIMQENERLDQGGRDEQQDSVENLKRI